ncbi:hypothetical protein [Ferruginibacter profundus]
MKRRIFITVATLFFIGTSHGQKNEISMLNGRFSFEFPDSAKNQARGVDIMSADPNENNETRVIYDIGSKRIVFFAEELQMKSVDDLETKLKKEATKDFPFTVQKKDNSDSSVCYRITPQKFDEKAQAILLNSLIIKNPDNTLSKFSAYINQEAFKDKATFEKISEQVFASFKKGKRRLNLSAKTETFNILGTKTLYSIKLPENYIVSVDKKYDFEVYKIKKVSNYGEKEFGDLIIYFGFYPSPMYKEMELENFKTKNTEGEYMLQKLTWSNYQDRKRNLFLREQIFTDDDIQKNAQNHIAMIASSEQKIEELALIVKNSLLKYDK